MVGRDGLEGVGKIFRAFGDNVDDSLDVKRDDERLWFGRLAIIWKLVLPGVMIFLILKFRNLMFVT
jgi:hypothetical protein